jgi:hypothetical protein
MANLSDLAIELELRTAWWLPLYLGGLAFFCSVFQAEPDMERVARWVLRGTFLRTPNGSWHRFSRVYRILDKAIES